MTKLMTVEGMDKVTKTGVRVIVAHSYNAWGESRGYGVWKLCDNYNAGRMVKTWRAKSTGLTKEEAIKQFVKIT